MPPSQLNGAYGLANAPEITRQTVEYSYLPEMIGHLAGLIHLRATQLCTNALGDLALTPKQYVAIEFIAHNPHISQKEIAEHIGVTPAVMVNLLDVLQKRGFIERVRAKSDRRRHHVQLTETGEAIRPKLKEAAYAVEKILIEEAAISPAEQGELLRLLRKLTDR